ncbi:MAG: alpha-N-arabinofuranosidase [Prevotella sp.]|jgi:alpha-N-arabinofuranosidase|nr:alpha-N-arabinofuranosidase [Prevotella sp.]
MKRLFTTTFFAVAATIAACGQNATLTVLTNQGKQKINREIYGQFAEHLGSCIYGGLWVGPYSNIPNVKGYRSDVLQALKNLKVPVLRWPGGCFADDYHWMDGIGPQSQRPTLRNNNWGGTIENNSFGTNEFLNLCEMLGCEPYISGNVGSGTVKEMAQWVEYMTSDGDTPMARLRRQNGRNHPWKVKYFGIGNEAWGCGGNMRPEYYSDLFRRYNTYLRDYSDSTKLFRIASGASGPDTHWTDVLMKNIGNRMQGISLHYYTIRDWKHKGSATRFSNKEYYQTLYTCERMDTIIKQQSAVMDKYDPQKKIGLMVDEWGTWWDEEPGTIKGHLYQQNCLRDAMVAALTLNIFQKHTDRVKMTNIAQVVNVLQSMILTDTIGKGHMVLTPSYYVFSLYKGFQDATYLPTSLVCGNHTEDQESVPLISTSAAKKKDGSIILSLCNIDLEHSQNMSIRLNGASPKSVSGQILTSKNINDFNDFQHPDIVKPANFKNAKLKNNVLELKIPAKSIVVLNIK